MVRLLFLALLAAGCALVQPPAGGPLVTVEATGGMCPAGTCRSVVAIEADGRVHQTAPEAVDISRVTAESIDALRAAIGITDFEAIRSRPFLGTCPTAFDGQEVIYQFAAPGGPVRIASCEVQVDPSAPVFVGVAAALSSVGANVTTP